MPQRGIPLPTKDQERIKELLLEGQGPSKISELTKIPMTTVQNYKRKFIEEGLAIPEFKGGRPKAAVSSGTPAATLQAITGQSVDQSANNNSEKVQTNNTRRIVINGIPVLITGGANVIFNHRQVIIDYGDYQHSLEF